MGIATLVASLFLVLSPTVAAQDFSTNRAAFTTIPSLSRRLSAKPASASFDCDIFVWQATSPTQLHWRIEGSNDSYIEGDAIVLRDGRPIRYLTFRSESGDVVPLTHTLPSVSTVFLIRLRGVLKRSSLFRLGVSVSGGANVLTIKRGSSCQFFTKSPLQANATGGK